MNIDNFCNLGAALQNKQIEVGKQPQVYFYRSNEDSIYEMLSEGYFNALNLRVAKDDLILLYSPKDEQKVFAKVVSNSGGIVQIIEMSEDDFQHNEMPTPSAEYLNKIIQYIGNTTSEYTNGFFYKCVESSGNYLWENIIVQDSYLKSETYNKTEIDTELAKKLNTDGSNTFTGVLKMRSTASFKGAVAPSWSGIGIYELNDNDSVSLMASMEKIDGFTPASNNTYNIGVNSRKWKNLYLAGKAHVPTINNGGDIAVPTVAGTMARVEDIENKISNCITYIPQDIKLEIENGSFVLKSGSKLTTGDGTQYVTTTDFTISVGAPDGQRLVLITRNTTDGSLAALVGINGINIFSGPTAPTTTQTVSYWYDTTNRVIKKTQDTGVTWEVIPDTDICLPIGLVTFSSGTATNKDQVFNGFGYIGSTAYVLQGVKGLIPNGRNADGTLKSIEFTYTELKTYTVSGTNTYYIRCKDNYLNAFVSSAYYDEVKNEVIYNNNKQSEAICGKFSFENSQITSFTPKTVFHALDYNDKEYIGHQAMPSDRYTDLTLGASGTSYTAPADGWVIFRRTSTASGQYLQLANNTSASLQYFVQSGANSGVIGASIPVKKGDAFTVGYNLGSSTNQIFRFIYSEGSK